MTDENRRIRVLVPDPPPTVFLLARFPGPNLVFIRDGTGMKPVMYREGERRRHARKKVRSCEALAIFNVGRVGRRSV